MSHPGYEHLPVSTPLLKYTASESTWYTLRLTRYWEDLLAKRHLN
jgi:hypothetical protein